MLPAYKATADLAEACRSPLHSLSAQLVYASAHVACREVRRLFQYHDMPLAAMVKQDLAGLHETGRLLQNAEAYSCFHGQTQAIMRPLGVL